MTSQWTDWLRELARAGQGGSAMSLPPITRGLAYKHPLAIEGNFSGDGWAADIRLSPDAGSDPLEIFTVTVGPFSDGETVITLELTAGQTALSEAGDDDLNGIAEVVFNLFHTPAGDDQYRAAGTTIAIAE